MEPFQAIETQNQPRAAVLSGRIAKGSMSGRTKRRAVGNNRISSPLFELHDDRSEIGVVI